MGVFVFQKLSLFLKKSTSTQEEQGAKKGGKISDSFVTAFCIVYTENKLLLHKKTIDFFYCKLSSKNSKFDDTYREKNSKLGESIITRGSIYEAFCIGTLA